MGLDIPIFYYFSIFPLPVLLHFPFFNVTNIITHPIWYTVLLLKYQTTCNAMYVYEESLFMYYYSLNYNLHIMTVSIALPVYHLVVKIMYQLVHSMLKGQYVGIVFM